MTYLVRHGFSVFTVLRKRRIRKITARSRGAEIFFGIGKDMNGAGAAAFIEIFFLYDVAQSAELVHTVFRNIRGLSVMRDGKIRVFHRSERNAYSAFLGRRRDGIDVDFCRVGRERLTRKHSANAACHVRYEFISFRCGIAVTEKEHYAVFGVAAAFLNDMNGKRDGVFVARRFGCRRFRQNKSKKPDHH